MVFAAADNDYRRYWPQLTLRQLSQASVGIAIGTALAATATLGLRRRAIT